MDQQDERERILMYLIQHQATYDRAALRSKLINQGFDPALIDQVLAEPPIARPEPPADRFRPGVMYLGLLAFGLFNFTATSWLPIGIGIRQPPEMAQNNLSSALIFSGIVVVAAGLAFALRRRDLAAGLLSGYAIMSIVSGGSCTYLTTQPSVGGPLFGLLLYGAMLVLGGLWLIVAVAVNYRRR